MVLCALQVLEQASSGTFVPSCPEDWPRQTNAALKRPDSTATPRNLSLGLNPSLAHLPNFILDQGSIPLYCSGASRLVHHNSVERPISCDCEDESSSGSSLGSCLLTSFSFPPALPFPPLPPPPPPPPLTVSAQSTPPTKPEFRNDYQGGIMMIAKRIQVALFSDPATKRLTSGNELPPPQKPTRVWRVLCISGLTPWHRSHGE
ncbi:hypothetical protein L210DRAFT_3546730 [Boletus edulis BED1]|uniref:Uncharacterized protein n=1 Tax=Boletus edulis BED1 TaxID=1328754 RepID=A0AAD4BRV9_BOLED|nr:hypothetical protein L210DRAFT_3546730 [Boletus edulis BED1]